MKHAAARYPGLIAVALLATAGALSARAQAPAAAPLRIAQAPAQAPAQGQAPASVDRARLEARLAAVGVLIDQSSAARQIESSGDSRAIDLRNRAREMGMRTLREDGVRKVLAGLTTPEEVIRATVGDVD